MFISHKSNVIQCFADTEWQCRMLTKDLDKFEYWDWVDSVTSGDPPVADYSGETGYTIVECTDENVKERIRELQEYVSFNTIEGSTFSIKYYVSKRNAEELKGHDGSSFDPKQYVQSHFVGQDDLRDTKLLADEWARIRRERTRLLSDTDHLALSDQTLSVGMKTYRTKLRDLPSDQSSKTKYSDITWPTES